MDSRRSRITNTQTSFALQALEDFGQTIAERYEENKIALILSCETYFEKHRKLPVASAK